jgi:hypothetical protein
MSDDDIKELGGMHLDDNDAHYRRALNYLHSRPTQIETASFCQPLRHGPIATSALPRGRGDDT